MVNVESNARLASSGDVPTAGTLQKGYMAFGNFGGKNKLYGNVGSEVVDLIGDAKTVLYFASQSELDTFLEGSDVPVGEWYAAVADKVYSQNYATVDVSGTLETGDSHKPLTLSNLQNHNFPYDMKVLKDTSSVDRVYIGDLLDNLNIYASVNVKGSYAGSIQYAIPSLQIFKHNNIGNNTENIDAVYDADKKLFTWAKDNISITSAISSWGFSVYMDGTWYETNECLINGTIRMEMANG